MVKKVTSFLLIILGLSMLSGCASGVQVTPSSTSPAFSPISPSSTPTLLPTNTKLPTNTETPTNTNTPTNVATLPSDNAYKRLNELLNDKSCLLPCWLGITPGQSTLQDVYDQLTMLSGITLSFHGLSVQPAGKWSYGMFTIPHPNDNMVIEIAPHYLSASNSGVVSTTMIETVAYRLKNGDRDVDIYGYPPFNDLMKNYTLSAILSEYGLPSQIYIYAIPTSPLVYFQIHVWYPEKGIFLAYHLLANDNGNSYQLCPKDALIYGYLTQSNSSDYQEFLLQMYNNLYQNFFPPSAFTKTTDEAFGRTSDEFYQLFRSPTTRCLNTPKTVWPVPVGP